MSKGLTVKGIAKLEAKLRKGTNLSDVKNVVKLNGSELQASAMKFAPVDTGYLKRNIHLSIENSGMTARISSDASYAAYQEYGTRYQTGTPHVKPAYNKQKPHFKSDLNKLMK